MPPTRSEQAADIFDHAVELPPESRAAYLNEACASDETLRRDVEALLTAEGAAGTFLSDPEFNPILAAEQIARADSPGSRIGRYKLIELIGEGGFGRVFLAEQDRPVRRRVALKIIKLGMNTREVIARFSAERQALALMDHPNIARVLDAGATDAGHPYFVMELVRGTPITRYCQENRLSPRQRLELFMPLCRAVQHAHQKGVIHRDLKPSNLLVTLLDGNPVAKIIDFGIAKATGHRLTDDTLHTGFHTMLGTPTYMSPEQATLSGDDVDTRTDVYSLGVVLYELLTGTTPFDAASMQNATFAEVERLIREVEPPKPSTRVWSMRDTLGRNAGAGPPEQLRSVLRGELDWIVMKCLEKQRSRRFESAGALATDIEAFLAGKPVAAAPPSKVYRARKFVQQHAIAIGAGAAIVTAMAAGLVIAVLALQRLQVEQQRTLAEKQLAERMRHEATRANETAQAVNDFVNDMLASADPSQRGKAITVEQLLVEADESIGERFEGRPLVEAGVHETIGRAFVGLGRSTDAVRHLQAAIDLRRMQGVHDEPEFLVNRAELAIALHVTGRFDESKTLFAEVIAAASRQLESSNSDVVRAVDVLVRSATYAGASPRQLEQLFAKATARRVELLGKDHPDTLACRSTWGWYVALASDPEQRSADLSLPGARSAGNAEYAQAEAIMRDAYNDLVRVVGLANKQTLRSGSRLCLLLAIQGRFAEAIEIARNAAIGAERLLGFEHPLTLNAYADYAELLKRDKQFEAALQLQLRRDTASTAVYGADSNAVAGTASSLGELYDLLGREEEAIEQYQRRLDIARRQHGADSLNVAFAESTLADKLVQRKRYSEALPLLAHALPELRKHVKPDSLRVASLTGLYARALFHLDRLDEAVPLAQESMDITTAIFAGANLNTRNTISRLSLHAAVILARARGPLAAESALRTALEQSDAQLKPGSAAREILQQLESACRQTGRAEEAKAFARRIAAIDSAQPATQPTALDHSGTHAPTEVPPAQ